MYIRITCKYLWNYRVFSILIFINWKILILLLYLFLIFNIYNNSEIRIFKELPKYI